MKFEKLLPMLLLPLAVLVSCQSGDNTGNSNPSVNSVTSSNVDNSSNGGSTTPTPQPGGKQTYTFEAEYCADIEDLEGNGYSGTAAGTSMIQEDRDGSLGASNKYFVGYLYKPGLTLTFDITSDKAISDAQLDLRLATQFYKIPMNSNDYSIQVNGSNIVYKDFALELGTNSNDITPFKDYTVSTTLSLVAGVNHFAFVTSNQNALGGTMAAEAPIFDCFKITTDAVLTWNPTIYF